MPVTRTTKVERLRYMTDSPCRMMSPSPGPITLTLYAAPSIRTTPIGIIVLKGRGARTVSVRTAREGERDVPVVVAPSGELTRGWLKAIPIGHSTRSARKPWEARFHKGFTRDFNRSRETGEKNVAEYRIQILGHREQIQGGVTGSASISHAWMFRPAPERLTQCRVHSVTTSCSSKEP